MIFVYQLNPPWPYTVPMNTSLSRLSCVCVCVRVCGCVQASAMWNLISTPAENGGAPFLPVSRVWSFTPGPINSDFTYG